MRVLVYTCDPYLWALQPFAYLFNKYWSEDQKVVVAGFAHPTFKLPSNFIFYSIDKRNFPPENWTDGLIHVLNDMPEERFILFLEDYWLTRRVDTAAVAMALSYVSIHKDILRFDLTADRLYAGGMRDVDSVDHYDIIETPKETPYQISLQTAVWNKRQMLELLVPGKTAWEFEIHTQLKPGMRVFGTRQWPIRYCNAVHKGEIDYEQILQISENHRRVINQWIPWKEPRT